MADISIRRSIQWGDEPPSEPTSTIVLTSPGRHFVDVRILLPLGPSLSLTPEKLDWAFAGTSSSTTIVATPQEQTADTEPTPGRLVRSVWRHWVDSRAPDAESVVDRADTRVYPDGRAVEAGRMVNPATGEETGYVEVWEEGEVEGGGEGAAAAVVVMRTVEEGGAGDKGMVVRVGQYVQGVLRTGEGVSVGRWERKGGESGNWEVVARMRAGLDDVVTLITGQKKGGEGLRVGRTLKAEGRVWQVLEVEGNIDGFNT